MIDAFLEHAAAATRTAWAVAVPGALLDHWWARGAHDRVYAVAELRATASGLALARYSALDRDPRRAARRAIQALGHTHHLEAILAMVPVRDPAVLRAADEATQFMLHEDAARRLLHEADELVLEDLQAMPELLAMWAARLDPERAVAALEVAALQWLEDDVSALALAVRTVGAWTVLHAQQRLAGVRIAALTGHASGTELLVAAGHTEVDRGELVASAIVGGAAPRADWAGALHAAVAKAAELREERIRDVFDEPSLALADAICRGEEAAWAERALVAAHAAARVELALPQGPVDAAELREVVAAACTSWREHRYRCARVLAAAGQRGARDLVRGAVDKLEQRFGPLEAHDDFTSRMIVPYYPGRARRFAAELDDHVSAGQRSHAVAGLVADGELALAARHAEQVLAEPIGSLEPAVLARVAQVALGGAGERLAAIVALVRDALPGASPAVTAAWLAGEQAAAPVARSADLEASMCDGDAAAALVYADFLQAQGDPRGELIALHAAGKRAEANLWRGRHRAHFEGGLAGVFTWDMGFIERAVLAHDHERGDGVSLAAAVSALQAHPSGALLRELVLAINHTDAGNSDFRPAIAALAAAPALRRVRIGNFRHSGPRSPDDGWTYHGRAFDISWTVFGSLAMLWPRVPRLEALTLQGCFPEPIFDGIAAPQLRELIVISGGLAAANTRAIVAADLPQLATLELWFGSPRYGFSGDVADLAPLLAGGRFPRLRRLRLMNAEFADELVGALATSPLLPQLSELSLALGTLSDAGARTLAHHRGAFAHLERLDLEDSCLTEDGIALVEDFAEVGDQKADAERYVSVSE